MNTSRPPNLVQILRDGGCVRPKVSSNGSQTEDELIEHDIMKIEIQDLREERHKLQKQLEDTKIELQLQAK